MAKKALSILTIWVFEEWRNRPEIQALEQKGHNVVYIEAGPDLILHPAAHRWNDLMWDYWTAVLAVIKQITGGKRAV